MAYWRWLTNLKKNKVYKLSQSKCRCNLFSHFMCVSTNFPHLAVTVICPSNPCFCLHYWSYLLSTKFMSLLAVYALQTEELRDRVVGFLWWQIQLCLEGASLRSDVKQWRPLEEPVSADHTYQGGAEGLQKHMQQFLHLLQAHEGSSRGTSP